ncbi:hypothetical protein ACWGI1_00185 [Streptomyces sp. NPDC054835]|uniref:hypothetical protein n=1 Tax=Streptomyces exfoliatus TaxID=1905 RepID=UPI0004BC3EB4|nr:hypothetical protein [Streptomyces exfoliatus]
MPLHFHFGLHPHLGVVARPTTAITPHLAAWLLAREQFELVPGTTDLYQLTRQDHDPVRRGRQAVHDLRRHEYTVHADYSLDPAQSAPPPAPARGNGPAERRARIAWASATRSAQRPVGTAPSATLPVPVAGTPTAAVSRRR